MYENSDVRVRKILDYNTSLCNMSKNKTHMIYPIIRQSMENKIPFVCTEI